jgi:hypothetical protein
MKILHLFMLVVRRQTEVRDVASTGSMNEIDKLHIVLCSHFYGKTLGGSVVENFKRK